MGLTNYIAPYQVTACGQHLLRKSFNPKFFRQCKASVIGSFIRKVLSLARSSTKKGHHLRDPHNLLFETLQNSREKMYLNMSCRNSST